MKALRRQRRLWSKTEKLAIITEALDSSVSNVARKYGIRPSLLFGWRKQFQLNNQGQPNGSQKKIVAGSAGGPTLEREYRKLAKIQAALSAKLKRDLANDAISAYNAGNTLISLYNGMSKLESLRNEMADGLKSETPNYASNRNEAIPLEAQDRQREIQRMAEMALVEISKRRIERNTLEQAPSQGQPNA